MVMLLDEIDLVGKPVPLRFTVGELVDLLIEVVDSAGAAVNITGRIYTGLIGAGGGAAALYTFTQIEEDYLTGKVRLQYNSNGAAAGNYEWVVWEDNDRYLWGGACLIEAPSVVP